MQIARKIFMFLFSGGVNTVFGFTIYSLLVLAEVPLWATVTFSMTAALFFNFLTYGRMVFKDLTGRALLRFVVFYLALAALNTALLHWFGRLGFGPFLAQAILVPALAIFSFIGLSYFVFSKSSSQDS